MSRIARDYTWLVGRTPLVELGALSPRGGGRIVAKLEALSPSHSNKDRAVLAMADHAERSGYLKPGGTVVEPSSGDTGLALAMLGARRGYRVVLVLPEGTPATRLQLLRTLGAEIVQTEASQGMPGAMARAEQIVKQTPDAIMLQPFTNRANARAHEATAREIWDDTDGQVGLVVCPVGTGGTAAGCLTFFRNLRAAVRVVAVEPARCAVLSGGPTGQHSIPGIGAGFVPQILNAGDLSEVLTVRDEDAWAAVRACAAREGILIGPASGAVLHGAMELAARAENKGVLVVAILPDSGERFAEHPGLCSEGRPA
ncbi:MAG: cysteine synthase family protein [Planctomycetes bacterium]|nr:cysteine synthase family protein [Planctomycetota bacterium]